jgi:hypothetical protein
MARKSTRAKSRSKSKSKGGKKAAASKRSKRPAVARAPKAAKASSARGTARAEKPAAAIATARPTASPAPTGGGTVLAAEVHLGHFFALRPRVETSFRPDDLRRAKQALAEERYRTIEDAARAVAEKALELARGATRTALAPFRG